MVLLKAHPLLPCSLTRGKAPKTCECKAPLRMAAPPRAAGALSGGLEAVKCAIGYRTSHSSCFLPQISILLFATLYILCHIFLTRFKKPAEFTTGTLTSPLQSWLPWGWPQRRVRWCLLGEDRGLLGFSAASASGAPVLHAG